MILVKVFEIAFDVNIGDIFKITNGKMDIDCMLTENGLLVKRGGLSYIRANTDLESAILDGSFKKKKD